MKVLSSFRIEKLSFAFCEMQNVVNRLRDFFEGDNSHVNDNPSSMGRAEELLDERRLLRHQLQRGQADPLLQDHALRHLRTLGIQVNGVYIFRVKGTQA